MIPSLPTVAFILTATCTIMSPTSLAGAADGGAPATVQAPIEAPLMAPHLDGAQTCWVLIDPVSGTCCHGGNCDAGETFPLMSVFKFPLALSVMHRVGQGSLKLDDTIAVTPADYDPGSWSTLARKHPEGGTFTIDALLRAAVAESDNNACDILLRVVGGPSAVQKEMHDWGHGSICIAATEREMHADTSKIALNTARASDIARLLEDFYKGRILAQPERDHLLEIMASASTGRHRLAAGLPQGSLFAHKTGTSDTDAQGRTAALGDAGIAVLPDGKTLILVVLLKDMDIPVAEAEAFMASVARYGIEWLSSETGDPRKTCP